MRINPIINDLIESDFYGKRNVQTPVLELRALKPKKIRNKSNGQHIRNKKSKRVLKSYRKCMLNLNGYQCLGNSQILSKRFRTSNGNTQK